MPVTESVFPLWHIALTAGATFAISLAVLIYFDRQAKAMARTDIFVVSLVAGLSVLAWRLAGNVAQLNDDPVPLFSPNDLLSPVVTYVVLGMYAALRPAHDSRQWERARTMLTVVSFVVNVILI